MSFRSIIATFLLAIGLMHAPVFVNTHAYVKGYGSISKTTHLPRTTIVSGYTRSNGTRVSSYARSR